MASQQERKDSAHSAPNPVRIQKPLGGLDYPIEKQDLLDRAHGEGADVNAMEALERCSGHDYDSPTGGSREVGKLD